MIKLKETIGLRAFGIKNIPILFLTSPSVISVDEEHCEIKIPLNYITKNHLGCMYFAVLAAGADCAGGLIAMNACQKGPVKVDLIFQDFKAEFSKRAEADVHFRCDEGKKAISLVEKAIKTGERVSTPIKIIATTPKVSGDEVVAKFTLTLSLKARKSKKK